jgi:hypothetical protein
MTIEIPLTRGYVTRIDDADRVFTDGRKWHAQVMRNGVYACTYANGRHTYLHRLLVAWDEVDHADGDGLNNCRSNLRDGTGMGKNRPNKTVQRNNTSGFKGVYRKRAKWAAEIHVNKTRISLGVYGTPEEAAYAYDQAAVSHFGEYAKTNAMLGRATTPPQHCPPVERTHCRVAGHEHTPENTYIDPTGKRECRTCRRERRRVPNPQPRGGKPCPPGCTCGRHRRAA